MRRKPRWHDYIFQGLNSQVIALDRDTGEVVWSWKSPKGSGFVTLMLDDDQLIASVMGYTYCLDPETGAERWSNHLKGFGIGIASLLSVRGSSDQGTAAAAVAAASQQAAAAT